MNKTLISFLLSFLLLSCVVPISSVAPDSTQDIIIRIYGGIGVKVLIKNKTPSDIQYSYIMIVTTLKHWVIFFDSEDGIVLSNSTFTKRQMTIGIIFPILVRVDAGGIVKQRFGYIIGPLVFFNWFNDF